MIARSRAFWVGLFVLGGIGLAIIALIWLGMADWLSSKTTYVTYFDMSTQGLSVGADVRFRGVAVGKVGQIRVAPDGRLVEVTMNLEPDFHVTETMRAALTFTGITGLKFIGIDHAEPDKPDNYPSLSFTPPHPVIPSYRGGLDEIEESLRTVYERFAALDTEMITERTTQFLETGTKVFELIEQFLRSPELSLRLSQLSRTAGEIDTLDVLGYAESIESTLADLEEGSRHFRDLLASFESGLHVSRAGTRADSLLNEIGSLVESGQQVVRRSDYTSTEVLANLNETLRQLGVAIEHLQALITSMETYPSNVLYTSPPRREK